MNGWSRFVPLVALGFGACLLINAIWWPEESGSQVRLREFGRLPVLEGGRVKPMDTLARNSLLIVSNRQTFTDTANQTQPAIKWLADVLATTPGTAQGAEKYKVFRIENDQVLNLLGLQPRSGFRYAISEFAGKLGELEKEANRADHLEPGQRDLFDNKVIELAQHLRLYIKLARQETPLAVPPEAPGGEWKSFAQVDSEARHLAVMRVRAEAARRGLDLQKLEDMDRLPAKDRRQFQELIAQFHSEFDRARAEVSPAAQALATLVRSYEEGKATEFNEALADYRQHLKYVPAEDLTRAKVEVFFNHMAPFYQCSLLYVVVFLLACFSWVGFTRPLNQAAFALLALTLAVHTAALILRMWLQGRPPVTNLYSSAIFIGWASVILGLVLEAIFGNGIGNVVGSVLGFLTTLVAHNLATSGDTLEMMQAVLDTNFWLATHVTCVTIGYAATFVAGALGIALILIGVFTPALNRELLKTLGQMVYGIVCFATFFSFTGTVLGGIWADQSWGRFWGWDPKENGALIIVLWNALILHARWGGIVKQRGMAVLAIAGNIVTAWSWFGVNMLGVGLHSYGFMSGAVFWLAAFIVSQLALIGVGLIPPRYWQSYGATRAEPESGDGKPRARKNAPVPAASS